MKIPVNTHRPKRIAMNMAAMIDVVFLLLIFFICTSNFNSLEEQLPMTLSHPGSISEVVKLTPDEEDFKFATIRVIAGDDGRIQWQIDGRTCNSLQEVEAVLRQLVQIKSDLPILIEMDDAAAWEHFIHVYDLCRTVGLSRVQLVGE